MLEKSTKFTLINTLVDMSAMNYEKSSFSRLNSMKLIDSDFRPPTDHNGHLLKIRLKQFCGRDFNFPVESCKQFTDGFKSLEILQLDWRKKASDLF